MKHRIVSLAPSATSILVALGARRELVGVSKWCVDVSPEVAKLPRVGDCWALDPASVNEFASDAGDWLRAVQAGDGGEIVGTSRGLLGDESAVAGGC